MSDLPSAEAMSERWRVRRLFSSACIHARIVNSEENWSLGRDHLDLWIRLHDLFYAREGELVDLVVVLVGLKLGDLLLPIGVQDVTVGARETLIDLLSRQCSTRDKQLMLYVCP